VILSFLQTVDLKQFIETVDLERCCGLMVDGSKLFWFKLLIYILTEF
jgi:hypothetical protein